jgi:hypothetical protein
MVSSLNDHEATMITFGGSDIPEEINYHHFGDRMKAQRLATCEDRIGQTCNKRIK